MLEKELYRINGVKTWDLKAISKLKKELDKWEVEAPVFQEFEKIKDYKYIMKEGIPMDELKPDKDGKLHIKLNPDDSALIVRADGTVEVVSREMVETEDGYVGDVEDLNKTFSLVLALAASLEDENLYSMIYNNLNTVLMRQWDQLDDKKRDDIKKIRQRKDEAQSEKEREEKDKRVDEFRDRMNRHRKGYYEDQAK